LKKILLMSDIHANIVSLKKVLDDAGNVDEILCAGDIVDYNPWPIEAIELVKEHGIHCVIGNHDRDAALGTPFGYNQDAEISCRWTHSQLDLDAQRFLLSLPEKSILKIEDVSFFLCHGSPEKLVDEYVYPPPTTPVEVIRKYLSTVQTSILILGHTHIPFIQCFPEGYVLNPGSIGQPRSGDPRASYVVMSISNGKIKFEQRLIEYDIRKVAEKIFEFRLPSFLAERLYLGI